MVAAVRDPLQEWLDQAVSLRADMLQSEVRFFGFLLDGERGACPWKGQFTDFEQLLEQTNLCSTQRYTAFRDAIDRCNGAVLKEMDYLGVDGVIEAGRIVEAAKRDEFIGRVVEGAKQQGCNLSPRRIKEIGHQVAPPPGRPHRGPADVAALKKENERLEKENAALRKENEQLRKQLAKKKK